MLKMIIELNEEKIKKDNKYSVEGIYSFMNEMFKRRGIDACQKGEYSYAGEDEEEGLFQFMVLASVFKTEEWFSRYVVKWLWYEGDDEAEDLIVTFRIVV